MSRKNQGKETRAILLQTGERLFAQFGFDGVSMRTLAKEAGVNLATVGYHFGGKAGLYEAIMDNIIASRDAFFPSAEEVHKQLEGLDTPEAFGSVVDWYVDRLARGMLGVKENIWPAFLISRELAQHSELYPRLDKEFFTPSSQSLLALVHGVTQEEIDDEEIHITAHCVIGMMVKFLESSQILLSRIGWESYAGDKLEKIIAVLSKRTRGLLGLPMERK